MGRVPRDSPAGRTTWRPTEQGYFVEVSGDSDEWHTAVHMVPEGDEWVIAEVRVLPARGVNRKRRPGEWNPDLDHLPSGGITRKVMQRVRPYRAVQGFLGLQRKIEDRLAGKDPPKGARFIDDPPQKLRKGRPPAPDCLYAWTASEYIDAYNSGHERDPVEHLAKRHDSIEDTDQRADPKHHSRISRRVKVARQRGLMTQPPAQGLPGGALTTAGREAIAECTHTHDLGKKGM